MSYATKKWKLHHPRQRPPPLRRLPRCYFFGAGKVIVGGREFPIPGSLVVDLGMPSAYSVDLPPERLKPAP